MVSDTVFAFFGYLVQLRRVCIIFGNFLLVYSQYEVVIFIAYWFNSDPSTGFVDK